MIIISLSDAFKADDKVLEIRFFCCIKVNTTNELLLI